MFDDTAFSRLLFEHNVTQSQESDINNLFEILRARLENAEGLNINYETEIYRLVPHIEGNYHFVEEIARTLHEEGRYEIVFETLYGDSPKFQTYLENHRS